MNSICDMMLMTTTKYIFQCSSPFLKNSKKSGFQWGNYNASEWFQFINVEKIYLTLTKSPLFSLYIGLTFFFTSLKLFMYLFCVVISNVTASGHDSTKTKKIMRTTEVKETLVFVFFLQKNIINVYIKLHLNTPIHSNCKFHNITCFVLLLLRKFSYLWWSTLFHKCCPWSLKLNIPLRR